MEPTDDETRPEPAFAGETGTDHRNRPGIGRACAVRFAERGATVVGGDRLDQSETAGTCTDLPGRSSRWLPT